MSGNRRGAPGDQHRLWTSVANAVDAYRRRVIAHPTAHYEHVWRLIHVHEALIVTLGALLATRFLDGTCTASAERRDELRRALLGEDARASGDALASTPGDGPCLQGLISSWIALLRPEGILREARGRSAFSKAALDYMGMELGRLRVTEGWRIVAQVPDIYEKEKVRLVDRFAAINILRNKFAHVPFPFHAVQALHWQLRRDVFEMLLEDYQEDKDGPMGDLPSRKWRTPLRGRLRSSRGWTTGSEYGLRINPGPITEAGEAWAAFEVDGGGEPEEWSVQPLFRFGPDLKVSLLFKIDLAGLEDLGQTESLAAEYHRFGAEAAPHEKTQLEAEGFKPLLFELPAEPETRGGDGSGAEAQGAMKPAAIEPGAPMQQGEAPLLDDEADSKDLRDSRTPAELRDRAERAFKQKRYKEALANYESLAKTGGALYNDVAKSRHAGALWRVNIHGKVPAERRLEPLRKAADLLKDASRHREPGYKARALYELSKVLWYVAQLESEPRPSLEESLKRAAEAAAISNDWSFISWYEKVQQDLTRASEATPSAIGS